MSLSETALKALNPFLNCTVGDFQPNALVCVRALGDLPTSVARDKVIDALKVASPLLSQSYSEYKQTPDGNHSQALFTVLAKEITKPSVYNALKDAYQSDSDIRKVVDGETANMNRTAACEDVKKRRMSSMIVNCVCNKADLMVYCRLLTVNEFANITRNGTGTGMRRKRSGPTSLLSCSPTFPKPGSATIAEGCLGGGCTIPILPVLEFQFNLETCLPPISWLSGTQMKTKALV
ncbi:Protein F07G11.9 [Aphelenchoides avenae]|nr:Protein F07G11.9 [Aphelenchus avenae]